MKLITVTRKAGKNPKEMLLELFAKNKETFIVMTSTDWFNEFCKCKGVRKDYYELNQINYNGYFINENESLASKFLLKIEVEFVESSVIITRHSKQVWNRKPVQKIYYFE